ncbi:MAG: cytochrome c5 family protein [Proteobacteria bacterium]|jgi:cytochrome c5|nr:cytochrome c5 family protein [Pseudomonadota bacterium]
MRCACLLLPALLTLLALLAGCGERAAPHGAASAASAASVDALRPADARLAAAYERSCLLCHGRLDSGAPATGDRAAWAPRLAKGLDVLVGNARNGIGGMPAAGLCTDCSDAELRDLILFMSATAAPHTP